MVDPAADDVPCYALFPKAPHHRKLHEISGDCPELVMHLPGGNRGIHYAEFFKSGMPVALVTSAITIASLAVTG
jgi:hypothetical protein